MTSKKSKRRPRLGEELMSFLESKKDRSNQPLDEVLTDPDVLDELKEEFVEDEKDSLTLF